MAGVGVSFGWVQDEVRVYSLNLSSGGCLGSKNMMSGLAFKTIAQYFLRAGNSKNYTFQMQCGQPQGGSHSYPCSCSSCVVVSSQQAGLCPPRVPGHSCSLILPVPLPFASLQEGRSGSGISLRAPKCIISRQAPITAHESGPHTET